MTQERERVRTVIQQLHSYVDPRDLGRAFQIRCWLLANDESISVDALLNFFRAHGVHLAPYF